MNQKDTIYIDVDDEITGIIDKLRQADNRIVALVLPKRAAVLQSVVNMKLLKRTAEAAKKHVVLITSEAGLLPLAGAVGLHVASSLQSKPAIPSGPEPFDAAGIVDETEDSADFDPAAAANRPIGQLAGGADGGGAALADDDTETIELDDEPADAASAAPAAAAAGGAAASSKTVKNKKLKVPNFDKFRLRLVLGVLALLLIVVLFFLANVILPKATIAIGTDSSSVTTNLNLTLDPKAGAADSAHNIVPARVEQKQQTGSQQVPASGQKNQGNKASGSVTMTAGQCSGDVPEDVPVGTGVSSNGLTFITQEDTSFTPSVSHGKCVFTASNPTGIIAQNPGASYNLSPSSFTVAGRSAVSAYSSDGLSGGTDNIIKVVAQADIDSAKQKIKVADSASVKGDLQQKLADDGLQAVPASFNGASPTVSSSAQPGDQTDTVTVTQTTTYTMYGVKQTDIKQFIVASVSQQIDTAKQKILNDGADKAIFQVGTPVSSGPLAASLSATSVAGPDLNVTAIKQAAAGKKAGDIERTIKANPGVTTVSVKYSPFWVSAVPKNPAKIMVVIDKAVAPAGQKP